MDRSARRTPLTGFLTEEDVIRAWTDADAEDLRRWWHDVERVETPLKDQASQRVTFVWRGAAAARPTRPPPAPPCAPR